MHSEKEEEKDNGGMREEFFFKYKSYHETGTVPACKGRQQLSRTKHGKVLKKCVCTGGRLQASLDNYNQA